jgi:dephospho-CoA kinase
LKKGKVYGLTGGIGSGKSTVARLLAEAGLPVIDADRLARSLREPGGEASPGILKRFGTVDPAELRRIVFADPTARKDLETILHPLIGKKSQAEFERHWAENPRRPVIYEATLLIEAGRAASFDGLIVVEAPLKDRIARVHERDGLWEDEIRRIIDSQLSDEERRKHATHLVVNSGSLAELEARVRELASKIF